MNESAEIAMKIFLFGPFILAVLGMTFLMWCLVLDVFWKLIKILLQKVGAK